MSRKGSGTFGLVSSGRGRGKFRGTFRGGRGRGSSRGGRVAGGGGASSQHEKSTQATIPSKDEDGTRLAERFEQVSIGDEVDEKLGFARVQEGTKRGGWLVNMHPVSG